MYECVRQPFQKPRFSCKLPYVEPGASAVVNNPTWSFVESSWLRKLQWTRTFTSSKMAAFNSSPTHVWNQGVYGYFRKSINNHRFTTELTSMIAKKPKRSGYPPDEEGSSSADVRGVSGCCQSSYRFRKLSLDPSYYTGSNAVFVTSLRYSMVRFSLTER